MMTEETSAMGTPVRPGASSTSVAGAEPIGRNAAFQQGVTGGPNHATSLQQNVDPMFRPDSVLSLNNIQSGNGLGTQDAMRRTYGGTMRPTGNGMSQSTYQQAGPLMSTYMNV